MDISSHGHLESRQLIEQGVVDFEIDNFWNFYVTTR
jgi:hypothetical protein